MKFQGLCQVLTCRARDAGECKRPENPACYLTLASNVKAANETPTIYVHKTQIGLGERYRDGDTDFEGVAIQVAFNRNGCEQVKLKALISSVPVEHWFDAPQLVRPKETDAGFSKKLGSK